MKSEGHVFLPKIPCFQSLYTNHIMMQCPAFLPAMKDGSGLSRYRADFHEIEVHIEFYKFQNREPLF